MTDNQTVEPCYLKNHGKNLLELGYPIVPITKGEKFPKGLLNWQSLSADFTELDSWIRSSRFNDGGVGILTGRVIAVDIDVYNPELTEKLTEWCHDNIGMAPVRIGQAPKSLLVYRLPSDYAEVGKSLSAIYIDDFDEHSRIEILGKGQQFVAYAIHPDTNKPYTWDNDLDAIDIDSLTHITPENIKDLFSEYHRLVATGDYGDFARKENSEDSLYSEEIQPAKPSEGGNLTDSDAEAMLASLKPRANITEERLVKQLSHIDPYDHDDWVRVGMGLYHQFDTGEQKDLDKGFEIWNDWSMTSDNYDPKVMLKRWRSFKARTGSNPVTLASVLKMANDRVARQTESGEIDALTLFESRYIYVADGDLVYDLEKPGEVAIRRLQEFKNLTANQRHLVSAPTSANPTREKLSPVSADWMTSPDRKQADSIVYRPDKKERYFQGEKAGTAFINSFILPEWPETHSTSNIGPAMEHLNFLFPIESEREWFLDWLAHIVQRPAQRCLVHPLLVTTTHGVGRGWVTRMLTAMLGRLNMSHCKFHDLSGDKGSQFNGYLVDVLVCSIGEVREGKERYEISDKVRDTLTEPELLINNKYGKQGTMRVYTRFLMNSNHRDALALVKEDRRIQVLTNPEYFKDKNYYTAIDNWLSTEGVGEFYWHLMRRDISKFDFTRSTNTIGRKNMIATGRNEADELFSDWFENCDFEVMTIEQVCTHIVRFAGLSELEEHFTQEQIRRKLTDKTVSWMNKSEGDKNRIRWRGKRITPIIVKGSNGRSKDEVINELERVQQFLDGDLDDE